MIPAYIINEKQKEQDSNTEIGIQLEIPDYSLEYEEWKRRRERDEQTEVPQTVIVIDIY